MTAKPASFILSVILTAMMMAGFNNSVLPRAPLLEADTPLRGLRLKDEKGSISGEAVPTLAAMLDAARDRIYLKIDFKPPLIWGRPSK